MDPYSWWAIGKVILGLGMVIFVHELGHFLLAKACGVKCEKFYVGFDVADIKIGDRVIIPRALIKFKWGETEYGIGILPLGGYVKMLGQEDNPSKIEGQRAEREDGADAESESTSTSTEKAKQGYDPIGAGPIDRSEMDPRNYQAKTVLQRMAIISAGVVFNLIFAVIFATIAFWMGVTYTPTKIGGVLPGGPGYENDLAGTHITEVNGVDTRTTYFPFRDLVESTVMQGETEMSLMVIRDGESQANPLKLTPQKGFLKGKFKNFAMLGLNSWQTNQIGPGDDSIRENAAAAKATVEIKAGDYFHKINGTETTSGLAVTGELSRYFDQEVEVILKRAKKDDPESFEEITTKIPTLAMMETGIIFEVGPVVSVQINSPAAAAGIQKGDIVKSIDGKDIGDPFTLPQRMTLIARDQSDKTIDLVVTRTEDGKQVDKTLKIKPRLPRQNSVANVQNIIGCDPLGIAFEVTHNVKEIVPGSPAEGQLKVGDEVTAVEFELTKELRKSKWVPDTVKEKMVFDGEQLFWASFQMTVLQYFRPAIPMTISVKRGDSEVEATLTPVESKDMFLETRGVGLMPHTEVYEAKSLWEAFTLGLRQTGNDMTRILKFLKKLVRGDLPVTLLGGPGTIATVATMEATEGTARLLLFLTLLSANLAIVNFLPIPILDGGHMVFLAYEGIFRRPVNEKMQQILTMIGLVFIICLMLFVIGLDISRFLPF